MFNKKKSVLIVDDEPLVRQTLAEYIQSMTSEEILIAQAENGHEAMACVERQRFDLVITDLKMPKMDGNRMLKHLSRLREESRPDNILVFSGYLKEMLEKSEHLKNVKFMQKPFDEVLFKQFIFKTLALKKKKKNRKMVSMDVKLINPFIESTLEVLKVMCGVEPSKGDVFIQDNDSEEDFKSDASVIPMNSPAFKGSMAISFEKDCFIEIYEKLTGERALFITRNNCDAAAELCNQIFGNAKMKLNEKGLKIESAIPTVVFGENMQINHCADGPRLTIEFSTEAGRFFVEAVLNTDAAKSQAS